MIVSKGALLHTPVFKDTTIWSGNVQTWGYTPKWPKTRAQEDLLFRWGSYGAIYRRQMWVFALVNKRANGVARLPLKHYMRNDLDRPEASADNAYAQLLRNPWPRWSQEEFWFWVVAQRDIYGESMLLKHRDAGGRPIMLQPIHPSLLRSEWVGNRIRWTIETPTVRVENIDQSDIVQFKRFNPDDSIRGLSPIEPLRQTLESEDAARRATQSFWNRGARPGAILKHPKTLNQATADRIKFDWERIVSGADNVGATVVLEEGMDVQLHQMSAEEAQYIETRQLARIEACAVYDMPPPAVHILDQATFSNIVEQNRMLYRDSLPPVITSVTQTLHSQIRDDKRRGVDEADFGDDVYSEFLLDEVLRGDFEMRTQSSVAAVHSGGLTIAEWRKRENLPFIEGTDQLFLNSAMVPLPPEDEDGGEPTDLKTAGDLGIAVQRLGLGVQYGVLSAEEARRFLPVDGPPPDVPVKPTPTGDSAPPGGMVPPRLTSVEARTVMGRLSRPKALGEVDVGQLTLGLSEASTALVGRLVADSVDVADLRARVKAHALAA